MSAPQRQAAANLRRWREHPVAFVREVFGVEPDEWQKDVLEAFPERQRLALKACKGPGKTCVLAWLVWNFLLTRPHPKVIATSITGDNLRDGLWSELSKWQKRSPMLSELFTWTAERVVCKASPETWYASARKWSREADPTQQADTLAGIHAEFVLFVIDEAGGVPDAVASAAEGALSTGTELKLLLAGNPTVCDGPLYRACTAEAALWWVKEITGDPDDPKRAPRISVEWARQQIAKWGRDNPWVLVNVFGRFPPTSSDALLDAEAVSAAMRRELAPAEYQDQPKVLGLDVARFGDDESVLMPRQGRAVFRPNVWRGLDTMALADQVGLVIDRWKPHATFVDVGGVGAGVFDRLVRLGHNVIAVNFGGEPADKDRFTNKVGEMWWAMAAAVRAGLALPEDPELRQELTARKYTFDERTRLVLERKRDLKKRGQRSPDRADALSTTWASPVHVPTPMQLQAQLAADARREAFGGMPGDYDPYAGGV